MFIFYLELPHLGMMSNYKSVAFVKGGGGGGAEIECCGGWSTTWCQTIGSVGHAPSKLFDLLRSLMMHFK